MMNDKKILLVFDFDGVIADSVGALYRVYLEFLAQFGKIGNADEFARLNGPKIPEIVTYLQKTYRLPGLLEDLINSYLKKVSHAYLDLEPVAGVIEIIGKLQMANVKMAIASSSAKDEIERFLGKYGLRNAFVRIMTGDEVFCAKPAPDIYLKLKHEFSDYRLYVVEDSLNGIKSAKKAELKVVAYTGAGSIDATVDWNISSMSELEQVVSDIENDCCVCRFDGEIEWREIGQKPFFAGPIKSEVNKIWSQALETNDLFNGDIFCCHRYFLSGNRIVIEYFASEYKNFYAQIRCPELKLNCFPIAVSGIVVDPCGKTIVGKRQNVTCDQNRLELIPSGSIEKRREAGGLDFMQQICREIEEEVGISANCIGEVKPFCLVFDEKNNLYDICCKIKLIKELDKCNLLGESLEYKEIEIVAIGDLLSRSWQENWVSTSRCILNWLQD